MNFIPYKSSCRRLLVFFALLVFSLLIFEHPPRTIAESDRKLVAVGPERTAHQKIPPGPPVGIKWGNKSKAAKVLSQLSKLGPVFPTAAFAMSNFAMQGLVKGKWPIVIVYSLEADSSAEVTITSNDGKQTFQIPLPPTNGERSEVKEYLPEAFGQNPQPGWLSFRALKNGPEPKKSARFFLYGLGVGDRAVGSLPIVQLRLKPPRIRPKLKEKASYSFRSLSDFNKVAAEFRLVSASDGSSLSDLVYSRTIKDGVRRGETVNDAWDGKNSKGKTSPGTHIFHVRAWRARENGGDYSIVTEQLLIRVEKE